MKYELSKKATGPLYVTEEDLIKQNANCPASEKTGEGPGSCGGQTRSNVKSRSSKPKMDTIIHIDDVPSTVTINHDKKAQKKHLN